MKQQRTHWIVLLLICFTVPVWAQTPSEALPEELSKPSMTPMEAAGLTNAVTLANQELIPPKLSPGPSITLEDALTKAAERNLDLASARQEIEKAKAGLSKSWGLVLPILQAKVEYTRMDHADEVDLAGSMTPLITAMGIQLPPGTDLGEPLLTNPQNKLVGSVQLMVPLVNPESWLAIKTAQKGVEVTERSIEQVERQLLFGVAQAYFVVLTTQNLIDFHYAEMQTTKEQLRIANARFNAGRGMRIDVIRAETDFEQARQSLLSASLSFDNARDTLGQLIGIDGLPMPKDSPTLGVPKGNNIELQQRAQSRLDVQTVISKQELLERQRKAVKMKFLPRLDMVWQGSYQFTDLPDMGSDDRSRWALVFSLTVPLYDHFRYAELDKKRAELYQAELNLQNVKQKASLSVRKAQRDYATVLTAVTTAEKQEALAKEGLALTESAYRNGAGTSLDVTQARQTYTAAGLNLATLQLKSQLALLSYLDAVGEDISQIAKK